MSWKLAHRTTCIAFVLASAAMWWVAASDNGTRGAVREVLLTQEQQAIRDGGRARLDGPLCQRSCRPHRMIDLPS